MNNTNAPDSRVPSIDAIPIRDSIYHSDDSFEPMETLCKIAGDLQYKGGYEVSELPLVLRINHAVWFYINNVDNTGHGLIDVDSDWTPSRRALVDEGLTAIGAVECLSIFREVVGYCEATEAQRSAMRDQEGFGPIRGSCDDWLGARDSAFYALNRRDSTMARLQAWLRAHPAIQPVEDLQWKFRMADIIGKNPLREARLKERGRPISDFVADEIAAAPLKKSFYEYAQGIASEVGIALPRLARKVWDEDIEGENCRLAHFIGEDAEHLAIYSKTFVALFVVNRTSTGMEIGDMLGRAELEYQEV